MDELVVCYPRGKLHLCPFVTILTTTARSDRGGGFLGRVEAIQTPTSRRGRHPDPLSYSPHSSIFWAFENIASYTHNSTYRSFTRCSLSGDLATSDPNYAGCRRRCMATTHPPAQQNAQTALSRRKGPRGTNLSASPYPTRIAIPSGRRSIYPSTPSSHT
jgi:hypothetical protein